MKDESTLTPTLAALVALALGSGLALAVLLALRLAG